MTGNRRRNNDPSNRGSDKNNEMSSGDHDCLENVIRDHVIGTVARMHGSADRRFPALEADGIGTVYIEELIAAILESDPQDFERIYERLCATDAPLPAICDTLIYPATDALGQMWTDDRETFVTISLASARLQSLINRLSEHRYRDWNKKTRNSILLGRMPGSSHTLGLTVVSACFRERGWDVNGGADFEMHIHKVPELMRQDHQVLGISIGTETDGRSVSRLIERMASHKSNRRFLIGVGGPGARNKEESYKSAGADFVATTARDAVFMAESQVRQFSDLRY